MKPAKGKLSALSKLAYGAGDFGFAFSDTALVALFKKMAASISLPLTLLVLDWSGFVSNEPKQAESAVWAIRILIGPIPSILLLAGIAFAIYYPLSRDSHAETRKKIAAQREASAD